MKVSNTERIELVLKWKIMVTFLSINSLDPEFKWEDYNKNVLDDRYIDAPYVQFY